MSHEQITNTEQSAISAHNRSGLTAHFMNFAFAHIAEALYLIDEQGRFLDVNAESCRVLGYSLDELSGMGVFDVDSEFPATKWLEHWAELKAKKSLFIESRHTRKNGQTYPVEINANYFEYEGKGYNLALVRDITERKQAEEALRSSEEKYRTLVENIASGVVVHAADSSILYSNPMASNLLGLTADQMIGKTCIDPAWHFTRHDGTTMPLDEYPVKRVLLSKEPLVSQVVGVCRPDRDVPVWVQCNAYPVIDADGAIGQVVVTFTDITERKQAEDSLLESEAYNRMLFDRSPIGLALAGMDGRLVDVNQAYADIIGRSIDETFKLTYWDVTPQKYAAQEQQQLDLLNTTGEYGPYEKEYIHKDGHLVPVRLQGLLIERKGEKFIWSVVEDITDLKRAEEERVKLESQLHQALKLESIGRLAGGVAHDFNNMLSVILGHAELGLMQLDPANPIAFSLSEISRTAERSADLTRQLLAFARKQTIAPKVLDLNETVSGMLKMLQRLIGEDIQLTWYPAPVLWKIKADPGQIDQILANLCVNARDAIIDTGRITIETRNNTVTSDYCKNNPDAVPGEFVHLSVIDDGSGMDEETAVHIFEPFFTTKGLGEGTGLGLATVYGIVRQNNGFITFHSEPGKGTTFSIHFPRSEENEASDQTEAQVAPSATGHETVLLVEDEQDILEITARMLEMQGYTVLRADSPGLAMELAREHQGAIHLLMTDVIMPVMNGRDLARNILALHPGMKRLFMSGYTADVIAHHGVLDDGVHFIQKPFSLPKMAAKVREVLDNS